jgi:hypothetical protein
MEKQLHTAETAILIARELTEGKMPAPMVREWLTIAITALENARQLTYEANL